MIRVRKFLFLSFSDQCLLVRSIILVSTITLGLRLLPFQLLRRTLAGVSARPPQLRGNKVPAARIAWAVKAACRYVPAADDLPRALTTQTMLQRRGYPAKIYIGLARAPEGRLEARAWVESEGEILVGGLPDLAQPTP
jgi:hypothetical protein